MLFVHIGFHKTGTSTIQHFAATHVDQLELNNVIYPGVGRHKTAHFNITNQLRNSSAFTGQLGGLSDLREEIANAPDRNFLVSSEAFHTLPKSAITDFKNGLPTVDVKIIAYIRDLSSLVVSAYFQTAKTGNFLGNFDTFFERRMSRSLANEPIAQGFRQLENWADAFGWPNLRVRALDRRHLTGGDLLSDFLDALELDWDRLGVLAEQVSDRNVSPGWKAVELIRSVQKAANNSGDDVEGATAKSLRKGVQIVHKAGEAIAARQDLNRDRGNYLTRPQWELCRTAYVNMLDRLNARLPGPPIPAPEDKDFEPREFLPEPDRVPVEERAAFYEEMTLALAGRLRAIKREDDVESRNRRRGEREKEREVRKSKRRDEKTERKAEPKQRKGPAEAADAR